MILDHMQTATAAALIVGFFAAHAAAILTHVHAPDWFQGAVTTVLVALAGVLPTVVWNPSDNWKTYLTNVFAAFAAVFFSYKTKVPAYLHLRTPKIGVGANLPGPRTRLAHPQQKVAE